MPSLSIVNLGKNAITVRSHRGYSEMAPKSPEISSQNRSQKGEKVHLILTIILGALSGVIFGAKGTPRSVQMHAKETQGWPEGAQGPQKEPQWHPICHQKLYKGRSTKHSLICISFSYGICMNYVPSTQGQNWHGLAGVIQLVWYA